jgi:hypothetical protein
MQEAYKERKASGKAGKTGTLRKRGKQANKVGVCSHEGI